MEDGEISTKDYIEIAEKVRSGEYFRDARSMFDSDIHDPMSDRYWYMLIILMFLIVIAADVMACLSLFPLNPRVPFIYGTNDIVDELPSVRTLVDYHNENPDVALRRFLVKHYVESREEYDAPFLDRSHNAVQSVSSPEALAEYEAYLSPSNPEGPIALYQRSIKRKVKAVNAVISEAPDKDGLYHATVIYDSSLIREGSEGKEEQPTRNKVYLAFQYKNIKLDEETGKIEPYGFVVTSYSGQN